jgi:hypothetical protein
MAVISKQSRDALGKDCGNNERLDTLMELNIRRRQLRLLEKLSHYSVEPHSQEVGPALNSIKSVNFH